jgi:hypothetical protein
MAERRSRRRVGPPAGIEHAYEVLAAEVARQLDDADLDRKLAVATAALIAVAGAIYAARPPTLVGGVISSWYWWRWFRGFGASCTTIASGKA